MVEIKERPGDRARLFGAPRWLVVTVGALAALLIVGFVALKVLFPPQRLRAMVVPRVEAMVGRDVELSAARLRVIPRVAVRLERLAIANAPGFSPEPAVRLEALDLEVRFWPLLLRREIELRGVRLLSPEIRYEVDAAGTSNFAGMGRPERERTPADTAQTGRAAALFISDLVLSEGRLYYSDARSGRAARMSLQAEAGAERVPGASRALESRGQVDLDSIVALIPNLGADSVALPDLRIEYTLFADLAGDSARLGELDVLLGDVPLAGSGVLKGLRGDRRIDFALESGEVDVARFLASLPPALRREALDASGKARLAFKALGPMGEGLKPEISGTIELADVDADYGSYGRLLTDGAGRVTFDAASLSLPAFTGKLLDRPFELQLSLSDFAAPNLDGRLEAGLDLQKLNELRGQALPAAGDVSVDLAFSGPLKDRGALRVTGPVQLSGVSYAPAFLKVPARVKSATLRLTGSGLSAERIPVELGKSDLTLSLSSQRLVQYYLAGDSAAPPPFVEFTARSKRLDIPEVWADTFKHSYGELMSARLAGRKLGGRDPTEIARERYKLRGLPPLAASGRVEIGELLNPPTEARDVAFDVSVSRGVIEAKNLTGAVYDGQLSGGLSFDLSAAKPPFPVRYQIQLKEAQGASFLKRWTRLGPKLSGVLDFNISGTATLDDAFLPTTNAVEATGRSTFREGRFDGFGPAQALVSRLKLEERLASQYKQLGGNFQIKDGAFVLDNWDYAAGDLKAGVSGSAGFAGTLDLKLAMELPPSVLERAGLIAGGGALEGLLGQLKRDDRPVAVSMGLGGTISDPALKVDTESLGKALEERLKGTGQDLLQRLLKPPKPPPDH